jgi:hypothetical protein
MATGMNRGMLGHRPMGGEVADGGREEKADAEEEKATGDERDVMLTGAYIATTNAT